MERASWLRSAALVFLLALLVCSSSHLTVMAILVLPPFALWRLTARPHDPRALRALLASALVAAVLVSPS